MNEEVKIERQLDVFKYTPDEIYDYIYEMKEENHQLEDRIEKAIEYIEENCYEHYDSYNDQEYCVLDSKQELLKILKGEENNNLPNSK